MSGSGTCRELQFATTYMQVRAVNAERWLDEMLQIADDESADLLAQRARTETR
jgi:hypothetical protein